HPTRRCAPAPCCRGARCPTGPEPAGPDGLLSRAGRRLARGGIGRAGMIRGIVFDKDGTLFDFRASWGRWAQGFIAGLARDEDHARVLADAIGYLPDSNGFAPDSPVIAATAADIAAALLPRSEEHTSELQSRENIGCRLL